MRKQVITLVGVLSLVLVAGSAFAQTVYIRGKIPFDFIIGKTTLPSGATVGEDEPSSRTRPGPSPFISGSTPRCAPALQPPGPPIGSSTPHPSFKWSRSEAVHFRVRFGLTAIRKLYRVTK